MLALVLSSAAFAASEADWRPSVRWRGFNVLSMFIKGNRPDAPAGTIPPGFCYKNPQEFREDDFQMMQDWGMNFARIPLDYRYWIKDGNPEEFDETAMGYIDRLLALGKRHGIHIMLNFHRAPGYMVARPVSETGDVWNDPKMQALCAKHWAFFARRYRGIPNEELSFNLFNEPPDMDDAQYGKVAKIMIDAIRREDPKRFIVSDGIGGGRRPCRALFGIPGVGQATRGYSPSSFVHGGGKVWPISPTSPIGVFATARKKGWYAPFSIADLPACDIELSFGRVSGKGTMVAWADGEKVAEFTIDPVGKDRDPLWKDTRLEKQWNVWQGTYLGTERISLPKGAKTFTLEVKEGDWITVNHMHFVAKDGKMQADLPFSAQYGNTTGFAQRFTGWKGTASFVCADPDAMAWRYPGEPGKEFLYRNVFRPWDEAIAAGVFVMVGEFGISPSAPHAAMLAWLNDNLELWDERGWGWAVWGLFRDHFGCLDNGRTDVPLEDYRGHKLDRAMLELLRAHGKEVRYGFESGDLQGWKVTEGAFARPVTDLEKEHNSGKPYTKEGRYFLSTLESARNTPNDGQSGAIESPTVRLSGPQITFRIGGGRTPTFSLVDRATGKILASASGANGETMRVVTWSVPEAVGKDVYFRVEDPGSGSWMHLTVDDIRFEGTVGKADFEARARDAEARRPTSYAAKDAQAPRVLVVRSPKTRSILDKIAAPLDGRAGLQEVVAGREAGAIVDKGAYELLIVHGDEGMRPWIDRARKANPKAQLIWMMTERCAEWGIVGAGVVRCGLMWQAPATRGPTMAKAIVEALGLDPVPATAFDNAEKAIRELGAKFPAYPAKKYLEELETLRCDGQDARRPSASRSGGTRPAALNEFLVRALVRDNPLVNAHEIAFVTRDQYRQDHHNTATIFQCGEINERSYQTEGALKAIDVKSGVVRDIVPRVAERTVRDPEVDYDGKRLVFSMRNGNTDDYHVYTVWADGTGLRQLTSEKGVSDIDPVWLPDGDIVFSSTRNPKYCMCNRHIMANLYRMRPNGANIHQIGVSTLFEGHSTVLPDGRILYDRWEYVDRDFGDAQGLWVCNADGTRHAIYWGNNTTSPGGVVNARHLPDGKVIAVLGSCHDQPWGALGVIDRTKGVDGQEPVVVTWPRSYREKIHAGGKEDFDSSRNLSAKYADPFPLDEAHFLAVRQVGRGSETALVYLDLFGNEVVFHEEAPGCHTPVVLRESPRPRVQAVKRTFDHPNAPGTFLLQDVYVGTHMQGVKRGAVKAIRVVESPEKRNWTGPRGWQGHGEEAPAMNWHSFENKRVLGTVPVEDDGSAYFELPANTFVYFQALDADGKMIQSMRSGAYVQPGETYGCVGCHEDRVTQAPPPAAPVKAALRAPSKLDGSYTLRGLGRGAPHFYSFQREVQPVFDRSCVKCHDYGKRAGEKLNLSGDLGAYFCTSYVDLWALKYVKCVGGGPAEIQPAYSWGAHASPLTKFLYGHGGAKLSDEDRDRVIVWMDLNAPYYPQYETAYPDNYGGRMPITRQERDRLQTLCGVEISNAHGRNQREQLDFTRPECSRILSGPGAVTNAAASAEALAIIRKGRETLAKTPRCDMDGFVPCETDQRREARYQRRLAREREVYKAIKAGKETFDER